MSRKPPLELEELVAHEPHHQAALAHGGVAQQHQLEVKHAPGHASRKRGGIDLLLIG